MMRAVIFDMDGVIFDSEPLYFDLEQRLFRDCGFTLTEQDHRKFVGVTQHAMWQELKDRFALKVPVEDLVREERDQFLDLLRNGQFPGAIPGVLDLIKSLFTNDIALAIASSSPRNTIETVCKTLDIRNFFRHIVSGDDISHGKPHPDIFLKAAGLLAVSPVDCLVIEDAHSGVTAAKRAGMKCAGFVNPGSGDQDLSKADFLFADFTVISVQKLEELFS